MLRMKQLKNGLIVIGTAAAILRISEIVALTAYSKKGPFVNNSAPPFDQTFGNDLENYLYNGQTKNGVPLTAWFGPYLVTTTPTFFNHNLKNASGTSITPDIVLCQSNGVSISNWTIQADWATMTSTQVKLTSNNSSGGLSTYGAAMKF